MISRLEIYKSKAFDPYENLATEKYLLDTVPEDTMRLYLWQNDNTVVIGKNQNPWAECNKALLDAEGGFVARRLSGGGAVFHDRGNLNFTFLCREADYAVNKHLEVIQKACAYAGIPIEISGRNDILAGGKKFSGNAFYHAKGRAYHHGTLLIDSDPEKVARYLTPTQEKLKAKGIRSLEARVTNLREFNPSLTPESMMDYMIAAAESVYELKSERMAEIDRALIEQDAETFGSWDYIYGKTLPFSTTCKRRFDWGEVEINLNLARGKIAAVKVFTDAMDFSLADKLETALLGTKWQLDAIEKRLRASLSESVCDDILSVINDALMP